MEYQIKYKHENMYLVMLSLLEVICDNHYFYWINKTIEDVIRKIKLWRKKYCYNIILKRQMFLFYSSITLIWSVRIHFLCSPET